MLGAGDGRATSSAAEDMGKNHAWYQQVIPNGDMFVGVAEDAIHMSNMLKAGDTVPVKFDPLTKEVASTQPAGMNRKWKGEDF